MTSTRMRSRSLRRPNRWVSALAALVALTVAGVAGSAMLSTLYTGLSYDFARARSAPSALAAARIAVDLAPWRSEAYMRLADAQALAGQRAEARRSATQRLRGAPADAYAWLQRARLHAAGGRFDAALADDYRAAQDRLPHSDTLNLLMAVDGFRWWNLGGASHRALWLASTAHSLRVERTRFLRAVIRERRERTFCSYAPSTFKGLTRWCATVPKLRARCAVEGLSAKQAAWCRREGFSRAAGP